MNTTAQQPESPKIIKLAAYNQTLTQIQANNDNNIKQRQFAGYTRSAELRHAIYAK